MQSPGQTSLLRESFRFPLRDRDARVRFVIGCAITMAGFFIPFIPSFVVMGYGFMVLRATARGEPPSMPPWDEWGRLISLGLRGWAACLVYLFPGMLVSALGVVAYIVMIFPAIGYSATESEPSGAAVGMMLVGMSALMVSMIVGPLVFALGLAPLPASLAHFVVKDDLREAFRARAWGAILWANRLGYFIAFVVVVGVWAMTYFVVGIAYMTFVLMCLVLPLMIPVGFYISLVSAAVFGQAYREGVALVEQRRAPAGPAAVS